MPEPRHPLIIKGEVRFAVRLKIHIQNLESPHREDLSPAVHAVNPSEAGVEVVALVIEASTDNKPALSLQQGETEASPGSRQGGDAAVR